MPPGPVALSPLKGMGFREVKVVLESKSITPPHKVMSHPAEPALVHPITASVVGYLPYPPKSKKPLASDRLIDHRPYRSAADGGDLPQVGGFDRDRFDDGAVRLCGSFITSLFRRGNYVVVPGVADGLAPVLAISVHKFGMENRPLLIFLTSLSQAVGWKFNLQPPQKNSDTKS